MPDDHTVRVVGVTEIPDLLIPGTRVKHSDGHLGTVLRFQQSEGNFVYNVRFDRLRAAERIPYAQSTLTQLDDNPIEEGSKVRIILANLTVGLHRMGSQIWQQYHNQFGTILRYNTDAKTYDICLDSGDTVPDLPSTEIEVLVAHLPEGTPVKIQNCKEQLNYNGLIGKIVSYNHMTSRYVVDLDGRMDAPNLKSFQLKNLDITVELKNLDYEGGRLNGVKGRIIGYNPKNDRYLVNVADESDLKLVTLDKLIPVQPQFQDTHACHNPCIIA